MDDVKRFLRPFIETELAPLESEVEKKGTVPEGVREKMGELGFFGLSIPEEYGGVGFTFSDYIDVVEEFGRTSAAFFSLIDDNNGMGSELILRAGSDEQKRRILPRLASGEAIASFALTEPDAGSDAAGIRTLASRTGDGYVLNGRKRFISNACWSRYFTVVTRTELSGDDSANFTAFVVERDTPGFTVGEREPMMSWRGSCQHELIFNDCHLDEGARLGEEGEGMAEAFEALLKGRMIVAAWALGAAKYALELGLSYAAMREQFGQPIGKFQGVQWLLADSATELAAAEALVGDVIRKIEEGSCRMRNAAMAKLFATETAGKVADRMIQVHGGSGLSERLPLERIYRDVRAHRIIEGTSEIQRMIVARSLLREQGMTN